MTFRRREHEMSAEVDQLRAGREFAARAAAEFGFDERACDQVRLALSEAITNAIQHGSRSAHDPIRIAALEEAGALVFEVTDTGRFVPRVNRRGDMPESGRGLEFMRLTMDEVELRPGRNGTRLRLTKRPD